MHHIKKILSLLFAVGLMVSTLIAGASVLQPVHAAGRDLSTVVPGGSILTGVDSSFLDQNNQPIDASQVTEQSKMALVYHWALPEGVVQAGDYFKFKLPDAVVGVVANGALLDAGGQTLGTYDFAADGTVTLTFNATAAGLNAVKGDVTFTSNGMVFKNTGTQEILIPVSEGKDVKVPITVKPYQRIDIAKTGEQVGETDAIKWTLGLNNSSQRMQNAWIDEQLPDNLELTGVTIHTGVAAPDGSVLATKTALKKDQDFEVRGNEIHLIGAYADTTSPLSVTVMTRLKDDGVTVDYQQVVNSATLHWDGKDQPTPPTATNQINMHYFPHKWLKKTFLGAGYGDQTYRWRVEYNENSDTLPAGTKLTDTPGPGQTFDPSQFWLSYGVYWDKETLSAKDYVPQADYSVSYSGGQMIVTLNKEIDQPLILEYGVKVPGAQSGQTLTNNVNDNYGHTTDGTGTITPDDDNVWLQKSVAGSNDGAGTIDWQVVFNATRKQLTNYYLTDTMTGSDPAHPNATLEPDTLKLKDDDHNQELVKDKDFRLTYTPGGTQFRIELIGDYANTSAQMTMTYTTKHDLDAKDGTVWTNTVDGPNTSGHSDYRPANKDHDNKIGFWMKARGYFQWEITANAARQTLSGATVTDHIEDDQDFKSVDVYIKDEINHHNTLLSDVKYDKPSDANEHTLTVHLPEGKDDVYWIVVKTTPKDPTVYEGYHNSATFDHGGTPEELDGNTIWPETLGHVIDKTGQQDSANLANVNWSVEVNVAQAHLCNAVVTDVASPNQIVALDSLVIYPETLADTNYNDAERSVDYDHPLKKGVDYTVKSTIDGETGETITKITFSHDIDQAYMVQYHSQINSSQPTDTVTNGVRIDADQVHQDKTEQPVPVNITVVGATAGGVAGTFSLTKEDADDHQKKLAGAEFSLTSKRFPDQVRIVTTDENGKATWKNLLSGDYLLKEIKAPAGYQISDAYKQGKEVSLKFSAGTATIDDLVVYNSAAILPHTGGFGRAVMLLVGALLAAVVGVALWWRQKKAVS